MNHLDEAAPGDMLPNSSTKLCNDAYYTCLSSGVCSPGITSVEPWHRVFFAIVSLEIQLWPRVEIAIVGGMLG